MVHLSCITVSSHLKSWKARVHVQKIRCIYEADVFHLGTSLDLFIFCFCGSCKLLEESGYKFLLQGGL